MCLTFKCSFSAKKVCVKCKGVVHVHACRVYTKTHTDWGPNRMDGHAQMNVCTTYSLLLDIFGVK